jgi:MOSC domain-containing protein YiiM
MNHCEGRVLSVARDPEHRFGKQVQPSVTLIEGYGIEGDAHAGRYAKHRFLARCLPTLPNKRQVHLIRAELLTELRKRGHIVEPGELGENVTTVGLNLEHFPLGTKLHLGKTAVVELTGIRTPCRSIDRFQSGLRKQMMRDDAAAPKYKCGVLGVVVMGGRVSPGDSARAEVPHDACPLLPAL